MRRIGKIVRKEFIQIRRDKATIYMVFIFPLMMLILYGFGIRYDVKSVPMDVFDQDGSHQSRQYIERFSHSPYFDVKRFVANYDDLQRDIDRGDVRLALVIPSVVLFVAYSLYFQANGLGLKYLSAQYSPKTIARRFSPAYQRTTKASCF